MAENSMSDNASLNNPANGGAETDQEAWRRAPKKPVKIIDFMKFRKIAASISLMLVIASAISLGINPVSYTHLTLPTKA